jgi:hypothetical protein
MCVQITSTKPCGHLTLLAWVYDNPPDPLCNCTDKKCPVRRLQIRKPHSQNCGTCQAVEYSKKWDAKRKEQAEKNRRAQGRDLALAKQKEMLKWLAKKREEQKKKLATGNGGRYGWWGEKFFE